MAHHATVVLTADHGVVDVALSGHVDFGLGPEMNSVESVGGEPRCLQLKLANPEAIDAVAAVWRERFGEVADIRTRDEVDDLFYGGALEGAPARYEPLLAAFDGWVGSLAARMPSKISVWLHSNWRKSTSG